MDEVADSNSVEPTNTLINHSMRIYLLFLSAVFLFASLAQANIFGPDNRTRITTRDQNLFHLVRVIATAGELCSGSLIGEDLVLTASHCVLPALSHPEESHFGVPIPNTPRGGLQVVYGFHSNQSIASSDIAVVYLGLANLDHYKTDYYRDFAILKLKRKLGARYGFMKIDENAEATSLQTKDLTVSAYDIHESIPDLHGHPLWIYNQSSNSDCSLTEHLPNGALYHDCNTEIGSSGAPLMKCNSDGTCVVIGVNVAEQRNGGNFSLRLPSYSEAYTNYAVDLVTVSSILRVLNAAL
jgi:V8-like Glu-specific endopeptidase